MTEYRSLILKNYMVATLIELLGIPLAAATARARNRFILRFNEISKEIEAERQALLKKFGDLDEKGALQIDTTGNYKLNDKAGFEKEFEEMSTRTLAVTCAGDQSKADFMLVKRVLENLETQLTVAQTTVYDEIMQAFEKWASPDEEAASEHVG